MPVKSLMHVYDENNLNTDSLNKTLASANNDSIKNITNDSDNSYFKTLPYNIFC